MNKWYSETHARKMQRRADGGRLVAWLAAIGALAACIFLCTRVTTGNAMGLLGWVVGLSTAAGWLAMLLMVFVIRPAGAQAGHIRSLLSDSPEIRTGLLTVSGERFQIPGSIVVRKAQLQTGEETLRLNLNDRLAGRLPPPELPVQVRVVRSFITAVEVLSHEEA